MPEITPTSPKTFLEGKTMMLQGDDDQTQNQRFAPPPPPPPPLRLPLPLPTNTPRSTSPQLSQQQNQRINKLPTPPAPRVIETPILDPQSHSSPWMLEPEDTKCSPEIENIAQKIVCVFIFKEKSNHQKSGI